MAGQCICRQQWWRGYWMGYLVGWLCAMLGGVGGQLLYAMIKGNQ